MHPAKGCLRTVVWSRTFSSQRGSPDAACACTCRLHRAPGAPSGSTSGRLRKPSPPQSAARWCTVRHPCCVSCSACRHDAGLERCYEPMKSSASIWVPQTPASPSWRARWVADADPRASAHAAMILARCLQRRRFSGTSEMPHIRRCGCGAAVLYHASSPSNCRVRHDTHEQDLQHTKQIPRCWWVHARRSEQRCR